MLDAFLKTRPEPIADPVETICRLAEERKLSLKFTDEVISSYATEPEKQSGSPFLFQASLLRLPFFDAALEVM